MFEIEQTAFDAFLRDFNDGKIYKGQRLGQAFYNHFKAAVPARSSLMFNIYNADGEKAIARIKQRFTFI